MKCVLNNINGHRARLRTQGRVVSIRSLISSTTNEKIILLVTRLTRLHIATLKKWNWAFGVDSENGFDPYSALRSRKK